MLTKEQLLQMKSRLTAEVIDDSEELEQWLAENGPDLIDEVILGRVAREDVSSLRTRLHAAEDRVRALENVVNMSSAEIRRLSTLLDDKGEHG